MKIKYLLLFAIVLALLPSHVVSAENICVTYFTGIGCPHCAKTDPVVLSKLPEEYANLLIIFGKNDYIKGDLPILENIRNKLDSLKGNKCPLTNGNYDINQIDFNNLLGKPKIWTKNRILIREDKGSQLSNEILRQLTLTDDLLSVIKNTNYKVIDPQPVPISGNQINFEHAVKIDNWIVEWNGEGLNESSGNVVENTQTSGENHYEKVSKHLTWAKIISLASVDAVNPCALAVLTLMLIAIMTYNPDDRKKIVLSGLAFTLSVYVIYLFYGLVIIRFFQLVQTLTSIRLILYKILAVVAIVLGLFNIKDFVRYRPGGLMTEMPLSWRPKAKKLINRITSPAGALVLGAFVTVFLLPCTMGPYVIAGGILSVLDLVRTIPWLLVYNFIFILPMLCVTLIVYGGIATVENVSEWKEKNIRYLHLIAGCIMFLLGVAMFLGWI